MHRILVQSGQHPTMGYYCAARLADVEVQPGGEGCTSLFEALGRLMMANLELLGIEITERLTSDGQVHVFHYPETAEQEGPP